MDKAGSLEILSSAIQPKELWEESGRWQKYGPELMRFQDRHEREFCLGPTHEEIFTDLVRNEIKSKKNNVFSTDIIIECFNYMEDLRGNYLCGYKVKKEFLLELKKFANTLNNMSGISEIKLFPEPGMPDIPIIFIIFTL